MPYLYTDEQEQFRSEARRFLDDAFNADALRALLESRGEYDRDFWRSCAEMGWTAIAIPEDHGGLGLGVVDLCVIAEECGRTVVGAPFLASSAVIADAIKRWASPETKADILPRFASGELSGALSLLAPDGGLERARDLRLEDGRLYGDLPAVTGAAANLALVRTETTSDGPQLTLATLDAPEVKRDWVSSIDNSRCAADIHFNGAPAEPLACGDVAAASRTLLARLATVTAFEQIGGAEAAMAMAQDYARERQAFGQPIGRFQAIKHRIAEMYVAIALARGNALRAAMSAENGAPGLLADAAAARLSASEAFNFTAREAMQTHGAIGVTFEHDLHLYYRRAHSLSLEAGSSLLWEDLLAGALCGEAA